MKKIAIIVGIIIIWCVLIYVPLVIHYGKKVDTKKPHITTSNKIIAALTKEIVGSETEIEVPGSFNHNFHSHDISPNDFQAIEKSDLIIITHRDDDIMLYSVASEERKIEIVELFANQHLIKKLREKYYPKDSASAFNQHFWLSPSATVDVFDAIFLAIKTSHIYKADMLERYESAKKKIIEKFTKSKGSFDLCKKHIFGAHDAFFYIVRDYNLKYDGTIIDHATGLVPNLTANMITMGEKNNACLLFEIDQDNSIVNKIREIAPKVVSAPIDIEGLTIDYNKGVDGYLKYIDEVLVKILHCAS